MIRISGYNWNMHTRLSHLVRSFRRRMALAALSRELAWRAAGAVGAIGIAMLSGQWAGVALWPWTMLAAGIFVTLDPILRVRLPTMMAAALELDRQCRSHELISSALAMGRPGDEFADAVAAIAQEAAGRIDVGRLDAGGTGTRAWIASLVLLGLLPMVYAPTGTPQEEPIVQAVAGNDQDTRPSIAKAAVTRGTPRAQAFDDAAASSPQSAVSDDHAEYGMPQATAARSRSENAGASAGGGLATGGPGEVPVESADASSTNADSALANAANAGGGPAGAGRSDSRDGSGIVRADGSPSSQPPGRSAPSRTTANLWRQEIPQQYHDVLKAYFDR